MSSRSKPFNSWLHRGWGLGQWPHLSDHPGGGAWRRALPAQFPTPPHAALALPRSPPVNVATVVTDHHSSGWGLEPCLVGPGSHQWTQLGGPSSKAGSWNQGGSSLGTSREGADLHVFSLFFFPQWILSDECNLGVAGARGSCRDVLTQEGLEGLRPCNLRAPSLGGPHWNPAGAEQPGVPRLHPA